VNEWTVYPRVIVYDMEDLPGAGSSLGLFVRSTGAVLVAFAVWTLPAYFDLVERSVLVFPYSPFHHLPNIFAPRSRALLDALRWLLIGFGFGCFVGVGARLCLVSAAALVLYFMSLDRTLYNNHYGLPAASNSLGLRRTLIPISSLASVWWQC
jgi:hypothetical protein